MYVYDACSVYVSAIVTVWGYVCCVAAIVKDSEFLALECRSMLYVCVRVVMNVVFSVCNVVRGAVGAHVWEVHMFRHADVCLCPVAVRNAAICMTCCFLMLVEDARGS